MTNSKSTTAVTASEGDIVSVEIRIPLPTPEAVSICAQVLRVDPPVGNCTKHIFEELHVLVLKVDSTSLRTLRVATHSLLEQAHLVIRTMGAFGGSK